MGVRVYSFIVFYSLPVVGVKGDEGVGLVLYRFKMACLLFLRSSINLSSFFCASSSSWISKSTTGGKGSWTGGAAGGAAVLAREGGGEELIKKKRLQLV
jgi:hypothetical protein